MMLLNPLDAAHETISLETQPDLARDSISESIRERFGTFRPLIQNLTPEDYEMLMSYYMLAQPQWCLARMCQSTQTLCSLRIRMALKKLCVIAVYKGPPPVDALNTLLEEHGLNHILPGATTAALIDEYRGRRSFLAVADALGLHRPDVRRAITQAANTLLADQHEDHVAMGAYIHGLIDKASVNGVGLTMKKAQQLAFIYRVDPACVGEFRVSSEDPAFEEHISVSHAAYD